MKWILSGLAFVVAILHTYGGGVEIVRPLLAYDMELAVKLPIYACWHMVTVFLFLSVIVFWRGGSAAFWFGALWTMSALVFVLVDLKLSGIGGLAIGPQWILLLPIGLLALWGHRNTI